MKNCDKGTQSRGCCVDHGVVRRCQVKDCNNLAFSDRSCRMHGGGIRCQARCQNVRIRDATVSDTSMKYIELDKKIVEGRAYMGNELWEMGDIIVFRERHTGKTLKKNIKWVRWHPTVRIMLEKEGFEKCIPWADNIDVAETAYTKYCGNFSKGILACGI